MNRIERVQKQRFYIAVLTSESDHLPIFLNGHRLKAAQSTELRSDDTISVCDNATRIFSFFDIHHSNQRRYPDFLTDKYIVTRAIDRGDFSGVKLAFTDWDCKPRALKMRVKGKDSSIEKYIRSELEVLQDVRHKGVIQLFDVMEDDDHVYMVMEYASGGPVPSGRLPEQVGLGPCMFPLSLFN